MSASNVVARELELRGTSLTQESNNLGYPEKMIREMLDGERPYAPKALLGLAELLGVSTVSLERMSPLRVSVSLAA